MNNIDQMSPDNAAQENKQLNHHFINEDNAMISDKKDENDSGTAGSSEITNQTNSSIESTDIDVPSKNITNIIPTMETQMSNDENKNTIDDINNLEEVPNIRKFRTIIDSDSDDDNEITVTLNKSKSNVTNSHVNELITKSKLKSTRLRIDSDSDDDIKETNDNNINDNQSENDSEIVIKTKSKKLNDLIDSESEDENDYRNGNNSSSEESNRHSISVKDMEKKTKKIKSEKKRTGTKRAAKDEAMRQIHSETQRLVRETPISLPYHRPKQRSLQEFLNRKKTPVIPQGCTVAAKLKMCTAIVSQVVKEKEKEAKLFYKSSDSEEDEITSVQSNNTEISSSVSSTVTSDDISIEETQKLHKIDIQNSQNKKQIIQQGILELGVPRKLFLDDNDPVTIEAHNISDTVSQQVDDDEKKIRKKEYKQGLKEVSVPRKLFDDNFDESTGESIKKCNDSLSNSNSSIRTDDNTAMNQIHEKIMELSAEDSTEKSESTKTNSNVEEVSSIMEISSTKSIETSNESSQILSQDKIIDLTNTQSTLTSNPSNFSNENISIHETPLINNKEIKNLNNRSSISSKSSSNELYTDNTSQSSEPDCGIEGLPPPSFDKDGDTVVITPLNVLNSAEKKIEQSEITPTTIKNNTLMNIPNLKPKLRGTPGTFIDFTKISKPNKEAVNNLVDRFISKHAVINKNIESNHEVTVIQTDTTADGIKIYKDVLPYKLPTVNESIDDPDLNKPGAKLMRLKEELKKKMASKRSEEWKQRAHESILDEEEEVEEFEPEEKEGTSLLNPEVSETEESEPEENDVLITDKKRKTCAFGDEEAEVDEDEEMELSDDEEDEEDEDNEEKYDDDGNEDEEMEKEDSQEKKKKFSRIIVDNEDSNSGEESLGNNPTISTKFERKRTDVDMFIDDEDETSVLQQNSQESQSNIIFKTPITPTNPRNSLGSYSSQSNSLRINSPCIDFNSKFNNLNSQSSDEQSQHFNDGINNKLFNTEDCNVTDEELMALCSGKFTDTTDCPQNDNQPRLTGLISSIPEEKPVTESQIIDMCSGTFSSAPLLSYTDLSGNVDETSQDIKLTFDDSSQNSNDNILKTKECKLDAVNSKIQSNIKTYLDIALSSDEESQMSDNIHFGDQKRVLKKKKKAKQLILSDDEDEAVSGENVGKDEEEEEEVEEEEGEEEEEEEEEDESIVNDEDEEKILDYDSEENEVVVVNKKDLRNVAKTFVDAEAELSESDWGSEDEDEKGLDKLELEEGDVDEIDEDQMRDQLGKLHARQVLDDDQRDVRMLKEMLFDDGDLHTDGAGRERKFKWRNIDKLDDENLLTPTIDEDDDNQLDPVELANDIEWRKLRLEREKFLEERMKSNSNLNSTDNDIDIESGGKLLKLGLKVLKKCKTNFEYKIKTVEKTKSIVPRTVSELVKTPDNKDRVLYSAMKRGSFLARGDEALARLALMIKKSDTVDLGPKHSKNFLFTNISPSVNGNEDEDDDGDDDDDNDDEFKNEKKEEEKNNSKPMRKRKTTGGTPRTTKKPKMSINQSAGKKLF